MTARPATRQQMRELVRWWEQTGRAGIYPTSFEHAEAMLARHRAGQKAAETRRNNRRRIPATSTT